MRQDDGFIAHFELAVFAAVLFTLLGAISEAVGVLYARSDVWRTATQLALATADNHRVDEMLGDYRNVQLDVTVSDEPCPMVSVRAERMYDGVMSRRAYVLRAEVAVPVTLFRTFSPADRAGEPC